MTFSVLEASMVPGSMHKQGKWIWGSTGMWLGGLWERSEGQRSQWMKDCMDLDIQSLIWEGWREGAKNLGKLMERIRKVKAWTVCAYNTDRDPRRNQWERGQWGSKAQWRQGPMSDHICAQNILLFGSFPYSTPKVTILCYGCGGCFSDVLRWRSSGMEQAGNKTKIFLAYQ